MSAARASLTRAQLQGLERDLRRECARLERSMTARMGTDDAAPPLGSAPQVAAQADGGLAVALETRTLGRHQMLADALRRLEAGTYGVCVNCHGSIPYGRLLVMPEATHCVACGARA